MNPVDINQKTPLREGEYAKFSASENHCTYTMQNPEKKHIRQFQVDGAVFPKGRELERCDVLLLNDTDQQSYYIELKGTDIPKAVRQIESSISLISPSIKNYTIFCRIVVHKARTHKIRDRSVIAWQNKRKGHTKIQSSPFEDRIEKTG